MRHARLPVRMPASRRMTPQPPSTGPGSRQSAVNERRQRAIEEALDVRVRSTDPYLRLEVRNPIHRTGYQVLLPTFPARDVALCTCTDFARRGLGTCKHIEATARWLEGHPAPKAPGGRPSLRPRLWTLIDRAIAARASDRGPESLAWRRPGRLLFTPA